MQASQKACTNTLQFSPLKCYATAEQLRLVRIILVGRLTLTRNGPLNFTIGASSNAGRCATHDACSPSLTNRADGRICGRTTGRADSCIRRRAGSRARSSAHSRFIQVAATHAASPVRRHKLVKCQRQGGVLQAQRRHRRIHGQSLDDNQLWRGSAAVLRAALQVLNVVLAPQLSVVAGVAM